MKSGRRIRRFANHLVDGIALSGDPLAEGLLDSLAVEQLISYLEEEYRITFDDEELIAENFASVDRLSTLVDAKRRARR